jgi:hypothetical protein
MLVYLIAAKYTNKTIAMVFFLQSLLAITHKY